MLKDDILASNDRPTKPISAPEWCKDGSLFCRVLSGSEREKYEAFVSANWGKKPLVRAMLICLALCDEAGKPVFDSASDINQVASKSGIILERICTEIQRHNKLLADDIKELEKNSGDAQASDSGSN